MSFGLITYGDIGFPFCNFFLESNFWAFLPLLAIFNFVDILLHISMFLELKEIHQRALRASLVPHLLIILQKLLSTDLLRLFNQKRILSQNRFVRSGKAPIFQRMNIIEE